MGVRTKTGGSLEAASVGALKSLRDGSYSRRVKKTSRKSDDYDKGEEKERSSKRMKENDVAELLLGLAHSAVPQSLSPEGHGKDQLPTVSPSSDVKEHVVKGSGDTGTEHEPKSGSTKREGIDAAGLQHLTAKGHVRLGPGDNRVRPPKAATKLLNSKWRHIRLPTVQAALEAEDWVVMFCHLRNPEVLNKDRVISMLNFEQSHYNEREVEEKLRFIRTAFELENFLKDRYSGNSQKKSRANDESKGRRSWHEDQGQTNEISFKIYRELEGIVDSYVSTQTAKSLNEFASQQNASVVDPLKGTQHDVTNKSLAGSIRRNYSINSTEKRDTPTRDSNVDAKGKQQLPRSVEYGNGYFMEYGMGLPWTMLQNPSTVADNSNGIMTTGVKSDVGRSMISGNAVNHVLGPFASGDMWIQSYMKFLNSASNMEESRKNSLKAPVKQELNAEKDGHKKPVARIEEQAIMTQDVPRGDTGVERPGRPPSYDEMVKWCVDLKRFLSQKDVMLTIEDVIPLVNNNLIYQTGTQANHRKLLVGSTLRKRVMGIYGITWSQVATSEDKDLHKKITNPDIMHAAKILMERKGFNANGRTAGMSDEPNNEQSIAFQDSQSPGDDDTDNKLGKDQQQGTRQGGSQESKTQNNTNDNRETTICVPQNIPESPELSHIIRKSKHQFLAFEEVALLLKSASQGILPVSLQVNYRPCSGTLYLINRSKVAKFRCDGYHFRKRETHTRKLLSSKEKLNCYYAGGPGDEIQRRSYWLLTESNEETENSSNRLQDIVLIHYMERKSPDGDDDMTKLMFEKCLLEQKIAEINEKLNC